MEWQLAICQKTWENRYSVIAAILPGSTLITEAWKIIDIKSITEKGLLLEEIEEPGMNWVNSEEGWREIFRPGSAIKKSRPDAGECTRPTNGGKHEANLMVNVS